MLALFDLDFEPDGTLQKIWGRMFEPRPSCQETFTALQVQDPDQLRYPPIRYAVGRLIENALEPDPESGRRVHARIGGKQRVWLYDTDGEPLNHPWKRASGGYCHLFTVGEPDWRRWFLALQKQLEGQRKTAA